MICSHISRGHLEYIQDNECNTGIIEIDECSIVGNELDRQMRRHMEIDADFQALFTMTLNIVSRLSVEDSKEYIKDMLFVLLFVYALFDLRMRTISTYNDKSHPDPDVRFKISVVGVVSMIDGLTGLSLNDYFNEIEDEILPIVIRIFKELGVACGSERRFLEIVPVVKLYLEAVPYR